MPLTDGLDVFFTTSAFIPLYSMRKQTCWVVGISCVKSTIHMHLYTAQHAMDLTDVKLGEEIRLSLRQSNDMPLGSLTLRVQDVVNANVAGWQRLQGGKPTAEVMIFVRWCGFFD